MIINETEVECLQVVYDFIESIQSIVNCSFHSLLCLRRTRLIKFHSIVVGLHSAARADRMFSLQDMQCALVDTAQSYHFTLPVLLLFLLYDCVTAGIRTKGKYITLLVSEQENFSIMYLSLCCQVGSDTGSVCIAT